MGISGEDEEKQQHFCHCSSPLYSAACVGSLLSVALFGCIFSMVRILVIIAFTRFDFQNRTDTKKPNKKMMYIYTLFAIIDAINISYGNISIEDLPESNRSKASSDLYDYTEFTKSLSKNISEHIDFYSKKIEERSNR